MRAGSLFLDLSRPDQRDMAAAFQPQELSDEERRQRLADLRRVASILATAHKFEARYDGVIDDDDLMNTAVEFARSGVLRMPFPACYFEFSHCVQNKPEKLIAAVVLERGPYQLEMHPFRWDGHWVDLGAVIRTDPGQQPPESMQIFDFERYQGDWLDITKSDCLRIAQYVISLTLFMSTKHAADRTVDGATDSANERRIKRGKQPLFEHHVLTIAPIERIRADLGGTHASPRLHWRRGHLRKLPSGTLTPVSPCLVGLAENGFVSKDYLVAPDDKTEGATQ